HGEGFHPDFPAVSPAIPVHGARLSEEENRILLIVKPPRASGLAVGRMAHDLVRLIDIGPTLLDALRLPPLPNADGVSLLPALRGEKIPPLWLYAETGYTHVPPAAFDPAHYSDGPPGAPRLTSTRGSVLPGNDRFDFLDGVAETAPELFDQFQFGIGDDAVGREHTGAAADGEDLRVRGSDRRGQLAHGSDQALALEETAGGAGQRGSIAEPLQPGGVADDPRHHPGLTGIDRLVG